MIGKGGFLRILEAFIAIVIIAGVMSFLYISQIQSTDRGEELNQLVRVILEKIASENNLRNAVLNKDVTTLGAEIDRFIQPNGDLKYHFSICPLNEICSCVVPLEGDFAGGGRDCPKDKEIYSDEISVSVTLNSDNIQPKVIRMFVWED